MSFFSVRTNQQNTIKQMLDNDRTISISGITWLFDSVEIDDLVFIVLSGDHSKKIYSYNNGLKAIARVTSKNIDEYKGKANNQVKSYSIDLDIVVYLPRVITKKDLYFYPDLLDCPNIGPETKGSPNQALGSIDNGISVLAAINDLLPGILSAELLSLIPGNYSLRKVYLSDFDEDKGELPFFLDRDTLVTEFVSWFNSPGNKKESYEGLVQERVILSWDEVFFDRRLFSVDLSNIEASIEKIKDIKDLIDMEDKWTSFSNGTSRGAPKALLGKENYLKFLQEFDFSKYTFPSIYTVDDVSKQGCFVEIDILKNYVNQLKNKKNIILQGPPGTGKTWLAQQLAKVIVQYPMNHNIQNVQFHPNYAYEDLIRGWRPRSDGKLELMDGPFLKMIELAKKNPNQNFVFIFDEINRGDPSVIFGEMLTLLENSKRNVAYALSLIYQRDEAEKIYIPENLYVIGTMNTADKSLSNIDFAFRRRFSFFTLEPLFNQNWQNWLKNELSIDEDIISGIKVFITKINDDVKKKNGVPYLLGHSFFVPVKKIEEREEQVFWVNSVIENDIKPLLAEYWYEELEKVNAIICQF